MKRKYEIEQPSIGPILNDPMKDYWVHFNDPPFTVGTHSSRFGSIKTWTHEFSEMAMAELLEKLGWFHPHIRFIDPLKRHRFVALTHLITSLHTRSYLNEEERTPDEYASETLKNFALCNRER